MNECNAPENPCGEAECVNTEGSFYCSGGGGGGFASAKVIIPADSNSLVLCPGGHGTNGMFRSGDDGDPSELGNGDKNGPGAQPKEQRSTINYATSCAALTALSLASPAARMALGQDSNPIKHAPAGVAVPQAA